MSPETVFILGSVLLNLFLTSAIAVAFRAIHRRQRDNEIRRAFERFPSRTHDWIRGEITQLPEEISE